MLTGASQLHFKSNELGDGTRPSDRGQELLMPGCIASFTLTPDEQVQDALCLEDGIVQVAASAITQRIWNLDLEFQFQDWASVQLAYDEIAQTVTDITLPITKTKTIDANGEIDDPEITTANQYTVLAYLKERTPVFMLNTGGATPTLPNEFQVDGLGHKLTFLTSQAGKKVQYRIDKTYTSIESIGDASAYERFGTLTMSGIVGGTSFARGMQIIIPELNRIGSPELAISGDLVTLTLKYRLSTPFGERAPFRLYNLDTAA